VERFLTRIGLSDENAPHELVSLFTEKKVVGGDILFNYNDPAEELFFLIEGHLAVHKYTGFLEKTQVIALIDPGAIVGECAILQQHKRSTRVTAIQDSKLLCLTKNNFVKFQEAFPEIANAILQYLLSIVSLRLEKTSERLARIL